MKKTRSLRRRSATFTYQSLESRQLLAADIAFPFVFNDAPVAAEYNLIENGDFSAASGGNQGFFSDTNVPGWSSFHPADPGAPLDNSLRIFQLADTARGNVVNLDLAANQQDGIYQDVATTEGQRYLLAFDLRNRPVAPSAAADTNSIEVRWNGATVGVFDGTAYWRTLKLMVVGGAGSTSRLEFREASLAGSVGDDGLGPLLDNVRLTRLSNSLIENGSFETVDGTGTTFEYQAVAGWNAWGPAGERRLQLPTGDAADGDRYLNVDSSDQNVNRIFQDVTTSEGGTYVLSLAARKDANSAGDSDELRIRWGGAWVASICPTDSWQTYEVVLSATSDLERLVIREPGGQRGDGLGPWVDQVEIRRLFLPGDLVIDTNGTAPGVDSQATFTEDSGPTEIMTDALEIVQNVGTTLDETIVVLTNAPDGNLELLGVNPSGTSIVPTFNATTKTLTLSGVDTVENYRAVLRSLTYSNTSQNPTTIPRTIEITVGRQGNRSATARVTLSVVATNDAPAIEPVADATVSAGQTYSHQLVTSDPEGNALSYQIAVTDREASASIEVPTISSSGLIQWSPTQSGSLEVTVTVTDSDGAESTEVFGLTSELTAAVPGNFQPFSGNRQLSLVEPSLRNGVYSSEPDMTLDLGKSYQAILETDEGNIVLDLFADKAPLTVNNFVKLAQDGFYDGLTFHRVISGFVAQGGDPLGAGNGGPGYRFIDEFDPTVSFNGSGVLAMANSGANTNGSQFFITYAPQTHLNGRHTIFGQLVSGQAALDALAKSQPGNGIAPDFIRRVQIVVS